MTNTEFDPHAFGAGAAGLTPDQIAANRSAAEAEAKPQLHETIGAIYEKAGNVGDLAAGAALPEAGYDDLPPVNRSPNESMHQSIHDVAPQPLTSKYLRQLDDQLGQTKPR